MLLTHRKKINYVIHFRLLQYFIELGAVVTKVHRAVQYNQSRIFKSYIDFNTEQRSKSTNELNRDYYKLKNNSIYERLWRILISELTCGYVTLTSSI